MKEKTLLVSGFILLLIVMISIFIYLINVGNIDISEIGTIAIVFILVALACYILHDRVKNFKKGLPIEDERLKLINYKAGFYGFIAAIWSAVGGPLIVDILFGYELEGHYVTAIVVLVSGFVFVLSYLYLSWRGMRS